MLFDAGNIITLAIMLLSFLVYHRLTINNRSLDKVKKFADKLQGELGDFVSKRAEELKHYGIDLDVQQKAARIALDKLQEASEGVAENADSIGAIAQRFKEYDEILSKLMDMTARVDENLSRIHDDQAFAESVNRKLDLAKKSIAAIDHEMPLLRESFARDARETVSNFRDGILSELREGLDSAKSELAAARAEALDALDRVRAARSLIDAECEEALARAAARASDTEDAAFATLTAAFDKRLSEASESVDRQTAQLAKESAQHASDVRTALVEFKATWANESQAMMKAVRGEIDAASARFAEKTAEVEASIARAGDSAEAASLRLSEAARSSLESVDDSLGKLSGLEASLRKSMEETETRIEEEFAAFGQSFEDHRTRFEENFTAETSAMKAELAQAKKGMAALREESLRNLAGKLDDFGNETVSELMGKKASAFKQLDGWLSDMERTLSGITAEARARRTADEISFASEARSSMTKTRDEVHFQLEKLLKNIDAVREHVESENRGALDALSSLEENMKAAAESKYVETLSSVRDEIEELKRKVALLEASPVEEA